MTQYWVGFLLYSWADGIHHSTLNCQGDQDKHHGFFYRINDYKQSTFTQSHLDLVRKRNELWSMSNLGPHHINEDCLHLELDFPSQTNSRLSKKIQRAQEIWKTELIERGSKKEMKRHVLLSTVDVYMQLRFRNIENNISLLRFFSE